MVFFVAANVSVRNPGGSSSPGGALVFDTECWVSPLDSGSSLCRISGGGGGGGSCFRVFEEEDMVVAGYASAEVGCSGAPDGNEGTV